MKVILAGLPKTGTKSIAKALRTLGYTVYDAEENMSYLGDDWLKILSEGGNLEDFRRMYENVDATCDIPVVHYWEELYKVFPDAKVILMMREDEDVWCESMVNQLDIMANSSIFSMVSHLSPSNRKLHKLLNNSMRVTFGAHPITNEEYKANPQALKIAYRNHNTRVMQVVPKDKLLLFRCRDGWNPLCQFLRMPTPKEPFPHENKKGEFGKDENLKHNPGYIKIKNEIMKAISIIAFVLVVALVSAMSCCYLMFIKGV